MSSPSIQTGHAGLAVRDPKPARERMELRAYRLLTRLAAPAAPAVLRMRERKGKEDPLRIGERLGQPSLVRPAGDLVWVHAASVGETSAVLPLMAAMEARRPGLQLLLTTGTVTSARFAAARISPAMRHQFVPLDAPAFVETFLDHWRPNLAIFTEQEIWPNLVMEAHRRAIPLALVNARMSDASYERWQRRSGLAGSLLSRFAVILAQSHTLADRFQKLGAARVVPAGNLKIDAPPPPVDPAAFQALDSALGERPRLVAASTHAGEEIAIVKAHMLIASGAKGLLTIVAPRHPERGGAVAEVVRSVGLTVARRSAGDLPGADTDIYVADTIGELGTLYASTRIAFVGGSLIPHGGQNPIEAVRHGAVVVTGPSTFNFADAYAALLGGGGALQCTDETLPDTLAQLLSEPARVAQMGRAATVALETLSGALDASLATLMPLIGSEDAVELESGSARVV